MYTYGFFGIVNGATIKNLMFKDVSIKGQVIDATNGEVYDGDSVGVVAGYTGKSDGHLPEEANRVTIENCHVLNGTVNGLDAVAGIVGRCYSLVTFTNCSNAANISATLKAQSLKVGAITAFVNAKQNKGNIYFTNCTNSGIIRNVSGQGYVGGISGFSDSNAIYVIEYVNCENTGLCFMGNTIV
ncbi:MAG: hypothetical protein ACI32E_02960 [Bacilli bacterium]